MANNPASVRKWRVCWRVRHPHLHAPGMPTLHSSNGITVIMGTGDVDQI